MKLINANKSYIKKNEEINIFQNLNVEFKKGKFYMIVGQSGTGKSTLINILGLLDTIDSGEYLIDGMAIQNNSDKELSKIRLNKIGMVFQDYYLNPRLTAYENILIATLNNKEIKKDEVSGIIKKHLASVGLEDRSKHYPAELSGGEMQRVCIVRALVNNPDYILADEPTGALDEVNAENIMSILKDLCNEGKCVIMVTHNKELLKYADYVYRINNRSLELED